MPLKIIHHRVKEEQSFTKENIFIDLRQNLIRVLLFCEKIVNFSNLILDNLSLEDFSSKSIYVQNDNSSKNKMEYLLDTFSLIVGKKVSLLEAVAKATSIASKVCKLADEFGLSFDKNDFNENEEVLTDEDIDVMVQLVKDFGEKQIREDARECRANITKDFEKQSNKINEVDVYDVYHNTDENNNDNIKTVNHQ